MVRRACALVLGREVGSLTLEELVTSRLAHRGIDTQRIEWDAIRKAGSPWHLTLTFTEDEHDVVATWIVDLERKSVEAADDAARALSENQVPPQKSPWRQTPALPAPNSSTARIDDVLATLDAQQPMPSIEELEAMEEPETSGSHPSYDPELGTASSPHVLPHHTPVSAASPEQTGHSSSAQSADDHSDEDESDEPRNAPTLSLAKPLAEDSEPGADAPAGAEPVPSSPTAERGRKKRNNRPTMPSWDEIVFGKKD